MDKFSQRTYMCNNNNCDYSSTNKEDFIQDKNDGNYYCLDHSDECEECGNKVSIESLENERCPGCEMNYASCDNCSDVGLKEDMLTNGKDDWYCSSCGEKCEKCEKVKDKDYLYKGPNDDLYCENCWGDLFFTCHGCNEVNDNDSSNLYEDEYYCDYCYKDMQTACDSCEEEFDKDSLTEYKNKSYCNKCILQQGLENYSEKEKLKEISYSGKDNELMELSKCVPISIKDLKKKFPSLSMKLKDLIIMSGGRDITLDMINSYREKLGTSSFPITYLAWHGGLQRTIKNDENDEPQLIMDIVASDKMINDLKSFTKEGYPLYDLFNKINMISLESGHPYSDNQLGWARLELHKEEKYILVDEIQCDHMNACKRFSSSNDNDVNNIKKALMKKYNLNDEEFGIMIEKYRKIVSDFIGIANEAVIRFAKTNGYKKLYWHTMESGKKYKRNNPPASLYSDIPKKHFYMESDEKPFGLESSFMMRTARLAKLYAVKYGLHHI